MSVIAKDVVKPNIPITAIQAELARRDLRKFSKEAWRIVEPKPYVSNWHIDAICDHLALVTLGEIRNLIINIPPRHTKSLSCSVMWPVWSWVRNPSLQFLFSSYAGELAIRDAVKSRRLIESGWFQERYGHEWHLSLDENKKDRYSNSEGGHRISASVGGKTTGEGGDVLGIDDPHNAKDVYSDTERGNVLDWYDNAWNSRLNDATTGQKVIICQRLHDNDLVGHILEAEGERWETLMLPLEYVPRKKCITYTNDGNGTRGDAVFEDPREEKGELLNPVRFGENEVVQAKNLMSARDYSAQYQQDPTTEGGLILKRHWWKEWNYPEGHPERGKTDLPLPDFHEIIQVYDTALEQSEEDDYTARTTWGIFTENNRMNAMLLERLEERLSFPELREEAYQSYRQYQPDVVLVEKKVSGHSLIQELRKKGVNVRGVKIKGDLVFRAHVSSIVLEKGAIWYVPRAWAGDVITQCAKFPAAAHDDIVASCVIAWQYLRRRHHLHLSDEEIEDKKDNRDLALFRESRSGFSNPYAQ